MAGSDIPDMFQAVFIAMDALMPAIPALPAIDTKTAAALLGISSQTLARIIKRDEGPPSIKLARRRLFRPETLSRWMEAKER